MYRLFIDHIEILPEAGYDGKVLKSISFRFSSQYGESLLVPEEMSGAGIQIRKKDEITADSRFTAKGAVSQGRENLPADRKADAGKEFCFTLDCTKLELTAVDAKATYAEIKKYVLDKFGLKVSSLYIAQIKRKYGLEVGEQYRKSTDPNKRVPTCPVVKEEAIKEALIHYKMI